jgi:hypothetical protein
MHLAFAYIFVIASLTGSVRFAKGYPSAIGKISGRNLILLSIFSFVVHLALLRTCLRMADYYQ